MCHVPHVKSKNVNLSVKFCVWILRTCINIEGKIRTQNLLKVNSELYTTNVQVNFEMVTMLTLKNRSVIRLRN